MKSAGARALSKEEGTPRGLEGQEKSRSRHTCGASSPQQSCRCTSFYPAGNKEPTLTSKYTHRFMAKKSGAHTCYPFLLLSPHSFPAKSVNGPTGAHTLHLCPLPQPRVPPSEGPSSPSSSPWPFPSWMSPQPPQALSWEAPQSPEMGRQQSGVMQKINLQAGLSTMECSKGTARAERMIEVS